MSRWDARSRFLHHGMFQSRKAQRQRILEAMTKKGRRYAGHPEDARKVPQCSKKHRRLASFSWDWQTKETATLLSGQCTTQLPQACLQRTACDAKDATRGLCKEGQEHMDSYLRPTHFMESAQSLLDGTLVVRVSILRILNGRCATRSLNLSGQK